MFSHNRGRLPVTRCTAPFLTFCVLAAGAISPQSKAQTPVQFPGGLPAVVGPQIPPEPTNPVAAPAGRLPNPGADPIVHRIRGSSERIEMTVNSSRIVTLDQNIPRAQVNNRDIVELTALSPNEIQVFAKKAGVTQINLWNENGQAYTIDCIVYGDAGELTELLRSEFPAANLRVRPMAAGVLLTGFVDRSDQVNQIIEIAQNYYPKVIPAIRVGGVQQVLLHVKVCEVS